MMNQKILEAEKRIQQRVSFSAEFDENKHPRANDGKFSSSGSAPHIAGSAARGKVREAEARVKASVKGEQRVTGGDVKAAGGDVTKARRNVAASGHSKMNPNVTSSGGHALAGSIAHGLADHEEAGKAVESGTLAKWAKEYDSLDTNHKTFARHKLHGHGLLSEDHMHDHHLTGEELLSHVNDGLNMMRRRHHSATQKPGDSDHYVTRMRGG